MNINKQKKIEKYILEVRDFNQTQLYRGFNEQLQLNLANYERNYGKKFEASILYDYQEFLEKKLKDKNISESEKQNLISIYTPIIDELKILV